MEQEEKQVIADQGAENRMAANALGDSDTRVGEADKKDRNHSSQANNDFSGSELEDDDDRISAPDDNLTGSELDDQDLSSENLGADLTANVLDKRDDTGKISRADAHVTPRSHTQNTGESGPKKATAKTALPQESKSKRAKPIKKMIIAAAVFILLCVSGVTTFVLWPASPALDLTAPVQAPATEEILPVSLDAFLIPFGHGKFSYISLNVSIDVPNGRIRNEIMAKKDLIRGQIYEALLLHVRDLATTPVPNDIKTIISKSVNGSLSNSSVRELYLTQFIVV